MVRVSLAHKKKESMQQQSLLPVSPEGSSGFTEWFVNFMTDIDLIQSFDTQDSTYHCVSALRDLLYHKVPAEMKLRTLIVNEARRDRESYGNQDKPEQMPKWVKEETEYLDEGEKLRKRLEDFWNITIREMYEAESFDRCDAYLDRERECIKRAKDSFADRFSNAPFFREIYESYFSLQLEMVFELTEASKMAQHLLAKIGFEPSSCKFSGSTCTEDPSEAAFHALSEASRRVISEMEEETARQQQQAVTKTQETNKRKRRASGVEVSVESRYDYAYAYLSSLCTKLCKLSFSTDTRIRFRWDRICAIATGFALTRYMQKYRGLYEERRNYYSSYKPNEPPSPIEEPMSVRHYWFSCQSMTYYSLYDHATDHPHSIVFLFRAKCPAVCYHLPDDQSKTVFSYDGQINIRSYVKDMTMSDSSTYYEPYCSPTSPYP